MFFFFPLLFLLMYAILMAYQTFPPPRQADERDDHSTHAIELVEATLKVATPPQVLQYRDVLLKGLEQYQSHGMELTQSCGPLVDVMLGDVLEDVVQQIGRLGVVKTADTDSAASTAKGAGLAVAQVRPARPHQFSSNSRGPFLMEVPPRSSRIWIPWTNHPCSFSRGSAASKHTASMLTTVRLHC